MTTVDSIHVSQTPIFNDKIAEGGPIAYPVNLDFTAQTAYQLDMSQLLHLTYLDFVQTLYVDTNGASGPVTITVRGVNQKLVIQANTQGYYPILGNSPLVLDFVSALANSVVKVILFNNPISPGQWATV